MNSGLRNGEVDEEFIEVIKNLDSAISKGNLNNDVELYRGFTREDIIENWEDILQSQRYKFKDDGYIYIFYHMAKNENDISNFSKNQYFRKGEMKSYFDPRIWDIITIIEDEKFTNHNGHPYHKKNHEHKVGHVFARKKNTRLVHKYYYEIVGIK